jgi:hypothetical protein
MNKLALMTFLTASLACPSAMADEPPAGPGPRAGTVEAMQCLTRQGPKGCERMFVGGAWIPASQWVFHDPQRDFQRGKLVFANYWGRSSESNIFDVRAMIAKPTREMDIYDVKFAHVRYTFYISPATEEGKIRALTIWLYAPHDPLQISPGRL